MVLKVALLGVSGRMGRALLRAVHDADDLELSGALASAGSHALGRDAGEVGGLPRPLGVEVTADRAAALAEADVAIDFTLPEATAGNAAAAAERGCPLVVGTTGIERAGLEALDRAAARIPVLHAPNTSLGVNLLLRLVRQAAEALPPDYDLEIFEAHHRHKADAPSGTALRLGEVAAAARGRRLEDVAVPGRVGRTGPRPDGAIGFSVVRAGDVVGEHTVFLVGPGERLELTHRAHDRMTFAYGALRAARWLRGRAPGRYAMDDVLGLG